MDIVTILHMHSELFYVGALCRFCLNSFSMEYDTEETTSEKFVNAAIISAHQYVVVSLLIAKYLLCYDVLDFLARQFFFSIFKRS